MAWTSDQEYAITTRGKNTIVSAGAGSGKTAVLTERMFRIIKNKEANVDELLVLTFTNAAAHEMKDRIVAALRKDNLFSLADQIEGSNVTTFDAYALSLVKKYSYFFSLPKDISIIDENIIKIKQYEYLDKIFSRKYEENDLNFIRLIKDFVVKNDQPIKDYIISILDLSDLKVDKEAFLKNKCQEVFNDDYIEMLLNKVRNIANNTFEECLSACDGFENSDVSDAINEKLKEIMLSSTYDDFFWKLGNLKLPVFRGLSEEDKALKSLIMDDIVKPIKTKIVKMGDSKTIKEFLTNEEYKNAYNVLFDIAIELDEMLSKFKFEKCSFTFADIAKMALELVKDKEINSELKTHIRFIMVDEYQDTSDIQESLIQALGNNNVFMVGDTKQSIYSFRNANCDIFQGKYESYKNNDGGEKIDLSYNFRSRHEVIDDLNVMFSKIMSKQYGAVDYKIDHIAISGNKDYDTLGSSAQNNNIEKIIYNSDELKDKSEEIEAKLVAEDIISKINNGYLVYDKNDKKLRPCKFGDFAILTDKRKCFDTYKKIFDNYQIPLKSYKDGSVMSSKIGNLFVNALTVISSINKETYDTRFKHNLVGLLRSFIYQTSDSDIYDLVMSNNLLNTSAYLDMKNIADFIDKISLSELVIKLFNTLDVYNKLILIGNVKDNEIILDRLINVSKTMESLNYSFDDFLEYLLIIKDKDIDIDTPINDNMTDVVKLMTIHKSKGLEFSIIYFPSLTSDFFRSGGNMSSFKTSNQLGLILPIINNDKDNYTSILNFINDEVNKTLTISERMRLFYVALTRTKEKSILIVDEAKYKNIATLGQAKTFLDFVSFYESNLTPIETKQGKIENIKLNDLNTKEYKEDLLTLKTHNIVIKDEIGHQKASKVLDESINEELLNFGNQLHLLLELTDFISKDTSFIEDKYQKHLIDKVLQLSVFDDLNNATILKEYPFFDEVNNVQGIIDLLIVKDDEIKIIDYKTKHIDDEAYVLQLKTYANYIHQRFDQPIHVYLLSIMDAKIEEKIL